MSAELLPIGDRELHVVYDAERGWQLPVYADPYSSDGTHLTHYAIRAAMGLLAGPHADLENTLRKHDLAGQRNYWVIEQEIFLGLSRKAPGITPAYYYKWDGVSAAAPKLDTEEIREDKLPAYEFLQHVAKQSSLDFAVIKLVWLECQRLAVDWLLNKQKPIRFSFMTIHPVPYRANWKEIQLAKHPHCAPTFKKPEHERQAELVQMGFLEDLGSTDLCAIDGRRKFFYWGLECVPTAYWKQCVREAESTRLGVKGPTAYTRYYEGRLKEHLPAILLCFAEWLRQMALPVGRVGESAHGGSQVLLPARKNALLPAKSERHEVRLMVSDSPVALKQGKFCAVEEKAARLLQMPPVPQGTEDLRGCDLAEDMDEPGDGD